MVSSNSKSLDDNHLKMLTIFSVKVILEDNQNFEFDSLQTD